MVEITWLFKSQTMQTLENFHSLISQGEKALLVSYFKVFIFNCSSHRSTWRGQH